jgi:hypothetical protein
MSSVEIHTIDISTPENILNKAIRNADVVVTITEMAETVKRFAEPVKKTVISVGSSSDVALLLNMLRPQ